MRQTIKKPLQLIPADGWWSVYANEDGTWIRQRIVAFALLEVREEGYDEGDDRDWDVLPIVSMGGFFDLEDSEHTGNYVDCFHADEWPTDNVMREIVAAFLKHRAELAAATAKRRAAEAK